jgi:hypothetical protein
LLILLQSALIPAPEETRNAQRMMRNQAINLRISAVHFFRDCNATVRVALLVVTSFCVMAAVQKSHHLNRDERGE